MKIRLYNDDLDRKAVISLLGSVFPISSPHHDPATSIDRKVKHGDNLFFVAVSDSNTIVGTVMAGYDGHRGWIYSLAVDPEQRKQGIGSSLLKYAENELLKLDCPKVNLQVMPSNKEVVDFYKKNGYNVEERISMGRKLYYNYK